MNYAGADDDADDSHEGDNDGWMDAN